MLSDQKIFEKINLSVKEIASLVRKKPSTIYRWKSGERTIDPLAREILIRYINNKDGVKKSTPNTIEQKPIDIPSKITGEEIAQLRNKMGLTQTELGDLIHVSKTTISNWENGSSKIDYAHEQLLRNTFETHKFKQANERSIRFKDFMRDEKLSQNDIADITGQSQPWVSKVVNQRIELDDKYIDLIRSKYPSIDNYIEFGVTLEVSVDDIINQPSDKNKNWELGEVVVFNWHNFTKENSIAKDQLAKLFKVDIHRINTLFEESKKGIPIPQNKLNKLIKEFGKNVIEEYTNKKTIYAQEENLNTIHKSMKPFYDVDFYATPDAELMEPVGRIDPSSYISVPQFRDVDFYIRVRGDSMYPRYRHGDIVPVKQVDSNSFFVYYEPYAIVTKTNNQLLIKYIHPHPSDNNKLLLVSYNSEKFPAQPIDKEEIEKLFHIKGSIGM